jgi:hypothetical protein
MTNGLFLPNAPGGTLVLQPGFVFWPPTATAGSYLQADVFFTIGSVLQQLRANAQKAIKSNRFQQTIVTPGNFGRYNDDQVSILRAAYPFEMSYADASLDSRELGRLIRRIVEASRSALGGAAADSCSPLPRGRPRYAPRTAMLFSPPKPKDRPWSRSCRRYVVPGSVSSGITQSARSRCSSYELCLRGCVLDMSACGNCYRSPNRPV